MLMVMKELSWFYPRVMIYESAINSTAFLIFRHANRDGETNPPIDEYAERLLGHHVVLVVPTWSTTGTNYSTSAINGHETKGTKSARQVNVPKWIN